MKEIFPTNVRSGVRLTTGWINDVGAMLNRIGQFSPGSTMGGFRSANFESDLPQFRTHIRPFVIIGFESGSVPGFVGEEGIYSFHLPGNPFIIRTFRINLTTYRGIMLRWNLIDGTTESDRDALESNDPEVFAPYKLHVNWTSQQFLLTGDVVLAYYDEMQASFLTITPPMIRTAKAMEDTKYGERRLFEIFSEGSEDNWPAAPSAPTLKSENIQVEAVYQWAQRNKSTLKRGTEVFIEYVFPMRTWYVTTTKSSEANFIHFTLKEVLTTAQAKAKATPDLIYDQFGAGVDHIDNPLYPDGETEVHNPVAGCTGFPFRFRGPAGCRGQATWSAFDERWYIWQLDCPPA